MGNPALQFKSQLVPAGQTLPIAVSGSFFRCDSASFRFQLSFDDGSFIDFDQGYAVEIVRKFRKVTLQNSTNADLTISYYVGDELITYQQPSQVHAVTKVEPTVINNPWGQNQVLANSSFGLLANPKRKHLIITNQDPNLSLTLFVGGAIGGTIFPQQNIVLETTDAVVLMNQTASTILWQAFEINYL